ncbi:MAG: hypothetical protein ACRCV0_07155 [Brevinema sp.]
MAKDIELDYYNSILSLLIEQGYDLFKAPIKGKGSDIIIRRVLDDATIQYIEIQILSRQEEYEQSINLSIKPNNKTVFCYFILYSQGMNKLWLLRDDELFKLRDIGLDERDTGPYLVRNFDRLNFPELLVEEFKKQKNILRK